MLTAQDLLFKTQIDQLNAPWAKRFAQCPEEYISVNKRHKRNALKASSEELLFIANGSVRQFCLMPNGQKRFMLSLGPGCLLNVPAVLQYPTQENALMECTQSVTVQRLNVTPHFIHEILCEEPALFKNLLHSMAVINTIFLYRSQALCFTSAMERLCMVLIKMHKDQVQVNSLADIADIASLHKDTVSRLLAELKKEGIIRGLHKGRVEIHNSAELERRSKGVPRGSNA